MRFYYVHVKEHISLFLNANCPDGVGMQGDKFGSQVYLHSEHHAIQTIFHELLVNSHELGDERLKVVDSFAPHLQSVLVVGCHVRHLCFQLAITVLQQLRHQTLVEEWIRENRCIRM